MAGGKDPSKGRSDGDPPGANQGVQRGEHLGRLRVQVQGGSGLVSEGVHGGEDQSQVGTSGCRPDGNRGVQKSSFLLQLEEARYKRPRLGQSGGGRELGAVGPALLLPSLSFAGEGVAKGPESEDQEDGGHCALVADQAFLRDSTGIRLLSLKFK